VLKFGNFIYRPASTSAYSFFDSEVDAALLPDTVPADTEIHGWEKEEDLGILQYLDRLKEVTEIFISR